MAYIFDPLRNTFIDDEDTSLGNKLALVDNEEIDKVIKQIDDKFGPGTVFPASELPPKENPYKDFEDRNPAADGGMIRQNFQYAGPVDFENLLKPKIYEGNRFTKKMPKGTFTMRLYEGMDEFGNRIENTYTGTKTKLKKIFDANNKARVAGDLPTLKDGEVYQIRQGANKGKFAIRMPKDTKYSFFDTQELAEQYKTNYLNDPANKVGGDRTAELENKKYSKGYKTKNQFIDFLKTKGINIKNPAAFASTYGIATKVNPYNANALIYDTSKLKNKTFVTNIIKRQVASGFGTEEQKLQFRKFDDDSVMRRYFNNLRRTMQKKFSVRKIEELLAANKASGLNLSHMDDLYSQYVTTRNIGYVPKDFNTQDLDKFDKKFREIYKKRNNLFKNKSTGWEQKVAKLNKDGITLAKASDGFKQFTVIKPDGKTRVVGVDLSKTIDPDDILKGKRIKDLSDEDIDLLIENKNKIIKNTTPGMFKKLLKSFGKKLPLAGVILGINEMANASEMGLNDLESLFVAYQTDAETAMKNKEMKESPFYNKKSLSGIGGYTGGDELPEIDPYQAAEGGLIPNKKDLKISPMPRVNFNSGGAAGADANFAAQLEYFFLNPEAELPSAQTFRETKNPISIINDMIDPRNFPYYADRLVESGIRIGEFGARVLPAIGKLASDLIRKPAFKITGTGNNYVQDYMDIPPSNITGTGIFSEFLNNLVGSEGTKAITEKTGLTKLIKTEEQKMKNRRSTIGPKVLADQATLGMELTAPVFPGFKLLKAYAKNRNLPVDRTTREIMDKEIDEVLAKQGISRRDFLKVAGAGGAVAIAKLLGIGDDLATVTKVAEKAVPKTSTVPPYFFTLVDKIKRLGTDNTKGLATVDREIVYVYKNYELYEDLSTGNIRINKKSGDPENFGYKEEEMVYVKGQGDEMTKGTPPDEYDEFTVSADMDGKMKVVDEGLEDIDDLIEEVGAKNITIKDLEAMGYEIDRLPVSVQRKLGIQKPIDPIKRALKNSDDDLPDLPF